MLADPEVKIPKYNMPAAGNTIITPNSKVYRHSDPENERTQAGPSKLNTDHRGSFPKATYKPRGWYQGAIDRTPLPWVHHPAAFMGSPSDQVAGLDIERIVNGQDVRTTIMVRNLPNDMLVTGFKDRLDQVVFGRYDFAYIRVDLHKL